MNESGGRLRYCNSGRDDSTRTGTKGSVHGLIHYRPAEADYPTIGLKVSAGEIIRILFSRAAGIA
jgi:hypothetical protein